MKHTQQGEKQTPYWDVIIVGAGAAGFFTALNLKEQAPHLKVAILEATGQPLSKVLVSGGGRCNVTTSCQEPDWLMSFYPRQHPSQLGHFYCFGPMQTVLWFEERGVPLKTEDDGRLFPTTDSSETIIDCFLNEAKRLGITLLTRHLVQKAQVLSQDESISSPRFALTLKHQDEERTYFCQHLVLATGSSASGYRLAEQLGLKVTPTAQALFTFVVEDTTLTDLMGLSVAEVAATLKVASGETFTQEGPVLVTHWGLSGPCILKLSSWGALALKAHHYKASLTLDLLPRLSLKEVQSALQQARETMPRQVLKNASPFTTVLAKRLWVYLIQCCGGDALLEVPIGQVKQADMKCLIDLLKALPLKVSGKGPFKEEFVTAGGVDWKALNAERFESADTKGLYVVGELLNTDGLTGGFNFQNAWTSAYQAATSLAEQANATLVAG